MGIREGGYFEGASRCPRFVEREDAVVSEVTDSEAGLVKSVKLPSASRLSCLRAAEPEDKFCSVGLVRHATQTTHRS
jgi:hypothetical protein